MVLTNLRPVVQNYLTAGVRYLLLALTVRTTLELNNLKTALPLPLKVVRLMVPLEEIRKRLQGHATTARHRDDLPEAAVQLASDGEGIEDLVVANDRPLRQVARDILGWLGWVAPI